MRMKIRETRLRAHLQWLYQSAPRALLLLAGILVLAFSSYAGNQTFQHVYPLSAGGSFLLDNVNGSVQVDGWARDEVEVYAVKAARSDPQDLERVKIEVESQPGQVSVHTRY